MLHRVLLWGSLGVLGLVLASCQGKALAEVPKTTPTLVATTTQLEDVLTLIADGKFTVIGLVPRNGDPHEYEPTPDDVKQVALAKAVFLGGAGLETWLGKLVKNAGGQADLIDTSQGLTLSVIDRAFEEGGETDPHVWMNPVMMEHVVDNVVVGLKRLDPPDAADFQARGDAYKSRLVELDAWAAKQLNTIPVGQRKLVTTHDAMGYFATRYGFEIIGAVIPHVSTEAADTSAQDLAKLVRAVKAAHVKTIFAKASGNPKFIEQVAAETKVKVDQLYVDSLGPKGGEAGTYLDFFRTDVTKLVAGLK